MIMLRVLSGVWRVYLGAINWFDALFADAVLDDEALLVEPAGDWLYAGYGNE